MSPSSSPSVSALRPSLSPNSTTDADIDLLVGVLERSLSSPAARATAIGLVDAFGGLAGVAAADAAALRREGLSEAGIAILSRVQALAVAMARAEACRRPVLSSWTALTSYLRAALAHAPREQFRTLYLDRRNILIREELRTDGTVDHAPVYPREVVRRALELSASAMILVHNHPSGDPTPSQADIEMTRRIIDAAKVFDIQVHDHVIVGREGTKSFRALGLM
ncbi:DNA repair protein RadC [Brevundimonas diminuta 3F5N]|uniref:DNA repair protein RadC n=1 Tax=Brevundimonas diminuta 3F5N TaxID=1255603 RepID=A0A1R4G2A7_BREDI|nr:DNA repair protein RadC [Brevundimonas diminuta]SJM62112.1 DNA repair protein RadC [Brevundimonas diminuta 3F5N]